jgi:hypothetical protein
MFEAPKKKRSDASIGTAEGTTDDLVEKLASLASDLELDGLEENEAAVEALARGMDVEESITRANLDAGEANNNQHRDGDDDVDGLVDLTALLSGDNLRRLKAGALPVRKVLVKASPYLQSSLSAALSALQLRRIAYAIVNSTTLVKPRWEAVLQEVNLSQRLMLRDVSTRWNSTYDMLVFALQYRKAVDSLTGDRKLDLRIYEMDDAEWLVAQQLADVLEVSCFYSLRCFTILTRARY